MNMVDFSLEYQTRIKKKFPVEVQAPDGGTYRFTSEVSVNCVIEYAYRAPDSDLFENDAFFTSEHLLMSFIVQDALRLGDSGALKALDFVRSQPLQESISTGVMHILTVDILRPDASLSPAGGYTSLELKPKFIVQSVRRF